MKSTLSCLYAGPAFVDKDFKHIITGNIRITNTSKLRKMLSKCSKYCGNRLVDYQKG